MTLIQYVPSHHFHQCLCHPRPLLGCYNGLRVQSESPTVCPQQAKAALLKREVVSVSRRTSQCFPVALRAKYKISGLQGPTGSTLPLPPPPPNTHYSPTHSLGFSRTGSLLVFTRTSYTLAPGPLHLPCSLPCPHLHTPPAASPQNHPLSDFP